MDLSTFSKQLNCELFEKLKDCNPAEDEILVVKKNMDLLSEAIDELKKFVRPYVFSSDSEEIEFFKITKPSFLSRYLYYEHVLSLLVFNSFKDLDGRREWCQKFMAKSEMYFERSKAFYMYYKTEMTCMDHRYFLRKNQRKMALITDDQFSTGYDMKLARLMACELFREYILRLMNLPEVEKHCLTWTGSKTDLIELIYALHSANIFNNGTANLKLIAQVFEAKFNVQLGDYYRTFQDLRIRKKSQAPFLDSLRTGFIKRLSDI